MDTHAHAHTHTSAASQAVKSVYFVAEIILPPSCNELGKRVTARVLRNHQLASQPAKLVLCAADALAEFEGQTAASRFTTLFEFVVRLALINIRSPLHHLHIQPSQQEEEEEQQLH